MIDVASTRVPVEQDARVDVVPQDASTHQLAGKTSGFALILHAETLLRRRAGESRLSQRGQPMI